MFGTFLQSYTQYTLEAALDLPWMQFARLLKALKPESYRNQNTYQTAEAAAKKMQERRLQTQLRDQSSTHIREPS